MSITNFVHLMGKTGKDVELVQFESGMQKANVSMATDSFQVNRDGERIKNTEWHNLVVWGKQAVRFSEMIKKGNELAVQGSIRNRSYTDKNGIARYVTEIVVSGFYKISKNQLKNQEESQEAENDVEALTPF